MKIPFKSIAHKRFLEAKRLQHYVFSTRFEKAEHIATNDQKIALKELLEKGDLERLRNFVDILLDGELLSMSMGQLRLLAKQYQVKEYYTLTKEQLLEGIENAKKRYSSNSA